MEIERIFRLFRSVKETNYFYSIKPIYQVFSQLFCSVILQPYLYRSINDIQSLYTLHDSLIHGSLIKTHVIFNHGCRPAQSGTVDASRPRLYVYRKSLGNSVKFLKFPTTDCNERASVSAHCNMRIYTIGRAESAYFLLYNIHNNNDTDILRITSREL